MDNGRPLRIAIFLYPGVTALDGFVHLTKPVQHFVVHHLARRGRAPGHEHYIDH